MPIGRPAQTEATERALNDLNTRENLYGIFWATEQADPNRMVEHALATNAFKASDDWHGNVRLAQYTNVAPTNSIASGVNLGDEIVLESYQAPASLNAAARFVPIELNWRPLKTPPGSRYKVFAHLLDARGEVASQRDTEPNDGFFPTSQWTRDETITDRLAIPIPPGLPPGDYRVVVGLYRGDTGERLAASDGADTIELGTVHVSKQILPRSAAMLTKAINQPLGEIEWLGYKLDSAQAASFEQGARIPLVLYFYARQKPTSDARLTVQLRDRSDNILASAATLETYPSSQWDKDEIVRDLPSLQVPSDMPAGEYRLILTDGAQVFEVTKIQVR